jgi:magnesium chelatase family protein
VLFLDELPEFRRHVLESMRQPLEDREVTIARAGSSLTYPAGFMLAAAMNPCPCGFHGDASRPCACSAVLVQRYLARVSGPLLDRIDIHVDVPAVSQLRLTERVLAEPSRHIRERVAGARERQQQRFTGRAGVHANAHMAPRDLREHCRLPGPSDALLKSAITRLGFSARAYHRVLKIARTIADLDGAADIGTNHVAEAIQYRSLDRLVRS